MQGVHPKVCTMQCISYLLLGSCIFCLFSSIVCPCILSFAQVVRTEAVRLTDAALLLLTLIEHLYHIFCHNLTIQTKRKVYTQQLKRRREKNLLKTAEVFLYLVGWWCFFFTKERSKV